MKTGLELPRGAFAVRTGVPAVQTIRHRLSDPLGYNAGMKYVRLPLIALCALLPLIAVADPGKDESGHGKHRKHRAEFKEEYWDGNCKVERKLEKNGDYKEERKCKGAHRAAAPVYVPAPVVVQPAPAVVIQPGLVIQGTVRVK
jgi:hypothetical protein